MSRHFAGYLYGWTPEYDDLLRSLCEAIGYELAGGHEACCRERCIRALLDPSHQCGRRDAVGLTGIARICKERGEGYDYWRVRNWLDHHLWLRASGKDRRRPYLLLTQPYVHVHEADAHALNSGLSIAALPVSPYGVGTHGYLLGSAEVIAGLSLNGWCDR
jgi:hypothetical protein